MSRLFIANCTQQNLVFSHRFFEQANSRPFYTNIPMFEQRQVGDANFSKENIEAIIEQNEKYGLVQWQNVKNHKGDHPIVYVCSVDKPVTAEIMFEAVQANRLKMSDAAQLRVKEWVAATAIALGAENPLAEKSLALTIEQTPGTGDPSVAEVGMGMKIEPAYAEAQQQRRAAAPATKAKGR